jgi:hypothetical protein
MALCRNVLAGVNVCQFKNFTVKCLATRMSGEMCTSLGNGFTNLMNMLFMAEEKQCTSVKGKVEGDDGLFTMYGDIPTEDDFKKLGFMLKMEEHTSLSEASFCGIIADENDLDIVTDPISEILSFGWTTNRYVAASPRKLKMLLKSKALSLAYQYPGCPILGSLAQFALRVTIGSNYDLTHLCGWYREQMLEAIEFYKKKGVPYKIPHLNTRLLVERKYGVSIQDQLKIEDYLDNKKELTEIYHPCLEKYFHPDTVNYWDNYVKYPNVKSNADLYYPHIIQQVRGYFSSETAGGEMSNRNNKSRRQVGPRRRQRGRRNNKIVREVIVPLPRQVRRKRNGNVNKQSVMGALGGLVGHGILQVVKSITGFGDYRIQGNSLMEGSLPPIINTSGMQGFVVRHREYIGDITATTAFSTTTFPINPGVETTFPWLAQIASSFEQYTMRGLIFEYKTMSSDALLSSGTGTALGTVVMATQYNALNPPFIDKRTMENYEFANSSKPSLTFYHPVECLRSMTTISELYVRTGLPPITSDIRLYDLGEFTIATQGMQVATGVIGELWCTFEVEFFKPKLIVGEGFEIGTDHFYSTTSTSAGPLTGMVPENFNTLGCTIVGQILTFPPNLGVGVYLVIYSILGSSVTISTPAVTIHNSVNVRIWNNFTTLNTYVPVGAVSTTFIYASFVEIVSAGATLTFGTAGTLPGGSPVTSDLFVTQVNENIINGPPFRGHIADEDLSSSSSDDDFSEILDFVRRLRLGSG